MDRQGIVAEAKGAPVELVALAVQEPGPGEVLVRIAASGVCHSDIHYVAGHLGEDFPYLLGHEGSGYIEEVGDRVDATRVGEFVVLSYRAPCGVCRFCRGGHIDQCQQPVSATTQPVAGDGRVLTPALGLGTFATHVVVAAAQAVAVSPECPPEAAALLGCAVSTGIGSVLRTADVEAGATVVVFGAGGVGVNVIQGARLARAGKIIAVDLAAKKLDWARQFGATDLVDASSSDPLEAIADLTGGSGVDYAFDAVGTASTVSQSIDSVGYRGTVVLIGFPAPTALLELPLQPFFYKGVTFKVSLNGESLASRDFPQMIDWYLDGSLDLDSLVTETIDLDGVESAFDAMGRGETIRSVITFGAS